MDDKKDKLEAVGDGRPVEDREDGQPPADDEIDEDIPDPETLRSVGY